MTGDILSLLGTNLAVMVLVMSLIAIPSFKTKDPSYIDAFWGIGLVVIAASSFLQTHGDSTRKAILLGLTALWGFRLGSYLFLRWRRNGPDTRYQRMLRRKKSGSDAVFIWRRVFLMQAVLLTIVALPVQLGQVYAHPKGLTPLNLVGIALALFGIAFESTADLQLKRFKANRTNEGRVMDRGLWAYTRHPNYFGEACTWWGLYAVCVVNLPTAAAIVGPLLITLFLMKFSGVGPLESQLKKTKPKYLDYIALTSGFVPMPKRVKEKTP